MDNTIPENLMIVNFIKSTSLIQKYSRHVIKMIVTIMTAMAVKGFTAKMTDIAEVAPCHRTTVSCFLSKSPWDEKPVKVFIMDESFNYIENLSAETGIPIYVSHDDTVNPKTKPSSQASRPMEGTAFHHSHLLGKTVWGHQVQATMISCGDIALIGDLHRYDNSDKAKTRVRHRLDIRKQENPHGGGFSGIEKRCVYLLLFRASGREIQYLSGNLQFTG